MSSHLVVIAGVALENPAQVRLARHDQMVQAFAANRADEPFDVSVLPRRARRDWVIADAHRTNAPGVRGAERAVAVAEQMLGCFIPREALGYLTAIHSAVGLLVTATRTSRLRVWRRITRP